MTEDQIEAARTKVRNMLHAADHGNHLGEMAVLRMAASGELFEALKLARKHISACKCSPTSGCTAAADRRAVDAALSLAQPYEAVEAAQPAGDA